MRQPHSPRRARPLVMRRRSHNNTARQATHTSPPTMSAVMAAASA
jgi:hypothetical protein